MLFMNLHYVFQYPIRLISGGVINDKLMDSPKLMINRFMGDGSIDTATSIPVGYRPPYQWSLPLKDGGIAASSIAGSATVSATASLGVTIAAATYGTSAIIAALSGAGQLGADIDGVGSVLAPLVGGLYAAATVAGQGTIAADAVAGILASAGLTGSTLISAELAYAELIMEILELSSQISIMIKLDSKLDLEPE